MEEPLFSAVQSEQLLTEVKNLSEALITCEQELQKDNKLCQVN